MRAWYGDKKRVAVAVRMFLLVLLILPLQSAALDSSLNLPLTVNPQNSGALSSCSYYFIDTYDGTVLPGGAGSDPAPTGTSIDLKFYNNVYNSTLHTAVSNPSTQSTQLSCAGTFAIIFTIELQANTNVATVKVTPTIKDSLGTTLYPPAAGSPITTLYPQCNNSSYTSTPYCTIGWVSGAVQVQLPAGDYVLAPTFTTDSSVTVLGGQLEIIYLHS